MLSSQRQYLEQAFPDQDSSPTTGGNEAIKQQYKVEKTDSPYSVWFRVEDSTRVVQLKEL